MILEIVREIGGHFTHEQYLVLSRIQGAAWSTADLVIVFYLLRIADCCRGYLGVRRHAASYIVLAATVPGVALIPFLSSAAMFWRLELAVTIPHFLIILYVCAFDAKHVLAALARRSGGRTGGAIVKSRGSG